MNFRFKAFGLHLLASAIALTCILGALFLGWYRWPGWYLADASQVFKVLAGVDLVVGPLLTGVIANPSKPRRSLARDIAIIGCVQLLALMYGATSLWNGRPLYYAFSEGLLQVVQAYDIDAEQATLGRRQNPQLAPHWYSLPRWIWAPLPQDPQESNKIVAAAITGGNDVTSMPRYFKSWEQGLASLRMQLNKVDDQKYFSAKEKTMLKARMLAAGLATEQLNTMAFEGRARPLLAVFDLSSLKIIAIFSGT
jgi:hypothetical protein